MKKLLLALTAVSFLTVSAVFANNAEDCKKCPDDKKAECTSKDKKGCDSAKDKSSCEKPAAPAEKKS